MLSPVVSLLRSARRGKPRRATLDERRLNAYKRHVLDRVEHCAVGQAPFYHLFIEQVLPEELYEAIRARMFYHKYNAELQDRPQDSAQFVNRRHSLVDCDDVEVRYFRSIFSDPEVRRTFLRKFYVYPNDELVQSIKIHEEFEFVYTAAGRFQNIHLDIPPKFMSFVFYFPERQLSLDEEERNATVLYDRELEPHYLAKFKRNSVCVFVPHFYSYHGFSSITEREVLVMFYINDEERAKWAAARAEDHAPYVSLKRAVESKLRAYPLIEYGTDESRLERERERCRVNAPQGRVMREESAKAGA